MAEQKRIRRDWAALKHEFVTAPDRATTSLREFAREKSIPINRGYWDRVTGWTKSRREYRAKLAAAAEEEVLSYTKQHAAEAIQRHMELWEGLLDTAEDMIASQNYKQWKGQKEGAHAVLKTLATLIEKAERGQRLALGLDEERQDGTEHKLADVFKRMREAFSEDEPDST